MNISDRTVRRRLNDFGLQGCIVKKKPLVCRRNRLKRLDFAKKYALKPVTFWKRMLWSDETKVNLFNSDKKVYARRPQNKEMDRRYTSKTVKHGGCSVMVLGCFSWLGLGPIVRINGIMDQIGYKNILERDMEPFAYDCLPLKWIFMHDNDPKHKAKSVTKWIEEKRICILDWPAQSPDLNPIENLWKEVKLLIKPQNIKNKDQLWHEIPEAWKSIPTEKCEKLVESMPQRCGKLSE